MARKLTKNNMAVSVFVFSIIVSTAGCTFATKVKGVASGVKGAVFKVGEGISQSASKLLGGSRPLVGSWQYKDKTKETAMLTFHEDMTFEVDNNSDGIRDSWGRYELFDNRVKLIEEKNRQITACFEPGFYYYEITDKDLRLSLLADQCQHRTRILNPLMEMVKQ